MNLIDLFATTFRERRNEVALEWACQEYTFGDLDSRANRMASVLAARALSAGDRLAVFLPNRLEYVDLFLAATRLGIIIVPINILYREREAGHILRDSAPRALVVSGAAPLESDVPTWQVDELIAEARVSGMKAPHASLDAHTPAALIYTSGTTGAAKGAVITHGSLAANATTLVEAWRITAGDRLLLALPLFHVHGLGNGIHCWLRSGAGCGSSSASITRPQPQRCSTSARRCSSACRPCTCGSSRWPRDRRARSARRSGSRCRVRRRFRPSCSQSSNDVSDSGILERYGMTETLMTLSNPYKGERRAGTVGLPLRGVETRLVDDTGRDVATGTIGELMVRTPTLCAGYWNQPELTARTFSDGWFHTGDLAMRSEDGYYTLCGRRSDLIISGGFNIYPREIEELLGEHPAVAEAAVAGVPDRVRGEVPMGFVVRAAGANASEADLIDFCRAKLASFKVPRAIRFVDRLPRTALGKIQKAALVKGL